MSRDRDFVIESNKIEGITRHPKEIEINEHRRFRMLDKVTIEDLVSFVSIYQPNAILRSTPNIPCVRVGNHVAPPSGPYIVESLETILAKANSKEDPFETHIMYETLHPFTDGNGRSGRILWLWMMQYAPLGFLHTWYYQSLSNKRPPTQEKDNG